MNLFGSPGADGERGKLGDHGQDGRQGETGKTGERGLQGVPGKDGHIGEDGHIGQTGKSNRDWPQLLAFLFIGLLGVIGFHQLEQEQKAIQNVVQFQCEQAEERRMQLRDLTKAVGSLGRDLTNTGPQAGNPNPRREALLERFDKFEREQLAKLAETTPCPPDFTGDEDR